MFDADYFKRLVNETSELINNKEQVDDVEEKIESNKLALQILSEDIQDAALKQQIKHRLQNLYKSSDEMVIDTKVKKQLSHIEVEKDILKNTEVLKDKARRFLDGLVFDRNILTSVSHNMTQNLVDTTENIKSINQGSKQVGVFNLLICSLILFIFVYFVIRFL